ncbi:MAG TPA: multifunctional oxoglutarate decarboxylase/oxoglutarate dehydrogenase thiamine pyrophosphate-binding subunit/dihydrolipoyllysine-residue succinyltransferase subunit, partial [Pedococcus sp.]|nr:multifunctional oxoglutarate decarboxylase/oxoglutarate dehydrogenase thiamine pyrophosphate-binding subunit/dihydrolipoyllysine-residue succinyltransferase subunit [Pedococcus sp.]
MPDQSPTNDPMAAFGPNEWLVDELYQQYLQDKNSVDQAWWEFFQDYRPGEAAINGAAAPAKAAPAKTAAGQGASAPATVQKQASTTDKPDAATDKAVADKPEDKEAAVGGQTAAAKVAAPREPRPEAKAEAPWPAEQPKPREPAGLKSTGPISEAEVKALRGASARVVTNMESSLQVPTATSVRAVPAKLLIDNRVVI